MQVLAEQDNQASTTDAKEVEKHSSLFLVQFRFLHSAFLMPEDKTCSGNNLLPNVNHAMFVSREALLEITDELNGFTFVIRHDNKHLYQYCRTFVDKILWWDNIFNKYALVYFYLMYFYTWMCFFLMYILTMNQALKIDLYLFDGW